MEKIFCKLFVVEGNQVLIRKNCESTPTGQKYSVIFHIYFCNYAALGTMPEMINRLPICCLQHLDILFDSFDEAKTADVYQEFKKLAELRKSSFVKPSDN